MKIWLDDQLDDPSTPNRHVPEGFVGAKNAVDFKRLVEQAVENGEVIEEIHLDNDLGEGEIEGYQLLEWLKENYPEIVVDGKTEINIHSENSVRREHMRKQLEWWRENPNEIIAMKGRKNPFGEIER